MSCNETREPIGKYFVKVMYKSFWVGKYGYTILAKGVKIDKDNWRDILKEAKKHGISMDITDFAHVL